MRHTLQQIQFVPVAYMHGELDSEGGESVSEDTGQIPHVTNYPDWGLFELQVSATTAEEAAGNVTIDVTAYAEADHGENVELILERSGDVWTNVCWFLECAFFGGMEETYQLLLEGTVIAEYNTNSQIIPDIYAGLVEAWNASTDPLKEHITAEWSSTAIILKADSPSVEPFTAVFQGGLEFGSCITSVVPVRENFSRWESIIVSGDDCVENAAAIVITEADWNANWAGYDITIRGIYRPGIGGEPCSEGGWFRIHLHYTTKTVYGDFVFGEGPTYHRWRSREQVYDGNGELTYLWADLCWDPIKAAHVWRLSSNPLDRHYYGGVGVSIPSDVEVDTPTHIYGMASYRWNPRIVRMSSEGNCIPF